MIHLVKVRCIKFCPFCGSRQLTHLGEGVIYCGFGKDATEEEVLSFHKKGGKSCTRAFKVAWGLTPAIKDLRTNYSKISQSLFRQGKIQPLPRSR